MLIILSLSAHAATTVVLPAGEDPTDWLAAVTMAGMTIGTSTGAPHVILSSGQLCAVLPPDRQRCVSLAMPQTDAAREEALWLARSLLREVEATPPPEPEPESVVITRPPPVIVIPEPDPEPEPVVVVPEPVVIPPPDSSAVPVAVSPMLRWRSDSGLAIGGTLSVMLPGDQPLQPLVRISGLTPDRLDLGSPDRQVTQLGASLGVRWQHDGPTAAMEVGGDWLRWRQDGEPIAAALLPQVTARLGWRLLPDGPVAWQPWLGVAAVLRDVTMSIDGDPIADPTRLSGLVGLSIERHGR